MDKPFKELLSRLHAEVFRPLGYKKQGQNFRLFLPDGLCRIVNFQRSAFNDSDVCSFCINIGIYYEGQPEVANRKFKEYDCILRTRVVGIAGWWNIFEGRDMEKLFQELKWLITGNVMAWFDKVPARGEAILRYGFHQHYDIS